MQLSTLFESLFLDHHPHHGVITVGQNRIFGLAVAFNVIFVVIEVIFGLAADSLALLADAGHNLGDVLGLLIAWGGSALAARGATERHTYGLGRATIMAALANALILLLAVGAIAWEAIGRFSDPQPVAGMTVSVVAAVGVLVNVSTALLFHRGRDHDLNQRGAYLHMMADAAVSVGVVIAGLTILYTDLFWIDPLSSLLISAVIALTTWSLLRESLSLAMDGVPASINPALVRDYLLSIDGVKEIHDLHIWAMSTTENALTVHVVKNDPSLDDGLLIRMNQELEQRFGIHHSTIQLEQGDGNFDCEQAGPDARCAQDLPGPGSARN